MIKLYKTIITLSTPLEIFGKIFNSEFKKSAIKKKFNFQNIFIILFLTGSIVALILPNFSSASAIPVSLAQNKIMAPKSLEEAQEFGEKIFEMGKKELPEALKKIWGEKVLPVWQKMYEWFKTHIWIKIKPEAKEEIEKRKSIIEQEFPKEKEELKKEIPGVSKSFLEKIKELIR